MRSRRMAAVVAVAGTGCLVAGLWGMTGCRRASPTGEGLLPEPEVQLTVPAECQAARPARAATRPSSGQTLSVDPGIRLLTSEPPLVSFRTREEGWASVHAQLFRTDDAGASWRQLGGDDLPPPGGNGPLVLHRWLSPRVGLVSRGGAVWGLDVGDGKRSWHLVRELARLHHVSCVGSACFASDWKERLAMSSDGGLTWTEGPPLPFTKPRNFQGLSFVDARRGWGMGRGGPVQATEDGGATWTPLAAADTDDLDGVLRLTPRIGWVSRGEQLFRTEDGGRRWVAVAPPAPGDLPVHRSRVTVGGVSRDIFADVPLRSLDDTRRVRRIFRRAGPWGDSGAVVASGMIVRYFECGTLVRAAPIVGPKSGQLAVLEGRGAGGPISQWGWAGDQVYRSEDGGASWFLAGTVKDGPLAALLFFGEKRGFARTRAGRVLRTEDGGHRWWPSWSPELDDYELRRDAAVVAGVAPPPHPLACLKEAAQARVDLCCGDAGCKMDSYQTRISWNLAGGQLERSAEGCTVHPPCVVSVSVETARAIAGELAAPLMRREDVHQPCRWTDSEGGGPVELRWRCTADGAFASARFVEPCSRYEWPERVHSHRRALLTLSESLDARYWPNPCRQCPSRAMGSKWP